ncbi:PolC-type DNA polymerase III [Mycoplasma marinum]|uniref:DNA polymerase III PolC-type n=1 Tax=Mycoplasma marinum TaxID=1937190 RepID=A0A4R0XQX3_9MOLU|nr:PolC-type DNA polymerase III [Mycoplasma marinum]TCG10770.1 PolC-type DNA polymerase III [Mycoplasma marinum]
MKEKFIKFAKKIKYNIPPELSEAQIYGAKLIEKEVFDLYFRFEKIPPVEVMEKFVFAINNNFEYKAKLNFKLQEEECTSDVLGSYVIYAIKSFINQPHLAVQLSIEQFSLEENILLIDFSSRLQMEKIENIKPHILKALRMFGFRNIEIKSVYKEPKWNLLEMAAKEKEEVLKRESKKMQIASAPIESQQVKRYNAKAVKLSIPEAKELQNEKVTIEGEIFTREDKVTKTGWNIIELAITDYKDAIYLSIFAGKGEEELKKYSEYKVGGWVNVTGQMTMNTYKGNQHEIKVNKIHPIESKLSGRQDNAPIKRVELNTKTIMSTMDGIASAKDYVEKAKEWGHSAIAILDSESVQSFPEFYHSSKGIKAIYGCSFNMVNKKAGSVINPDDRGLKEASYVVFDLATTGLSPRFEEIIEFGATKIEAGKITDQKQFFIKSTKPIPEFIQKLTGITDDMLLNAKGEEEAMKELREYVDGFILVAHNAVFDMGFIDEKLEKYGLEPLNAVVVDTLPAAKIVDPDQKRFRLENVALRHGHTYDSTVAHRADYDAEVLAHTWLTMISRLKRMGILTLQQLFDAINDTVYSTAFSKEVSIIAKNQQGLKELFSLVSQSLTQQYYRSPKLFWDELPKSKNMLVGSGGIKSKFVDLMLTGTTSQIKEDMKKYDYIEIQPLRNFTHLISRGNISKQNLKDSFSFIIKEAKKLGIPVVATSDARYVNDSDAIYHEVYINAKGLGGVRHYLFKYNERNPQYPTQSLLTTAEMKEEWAWIGIESLIDEIVVKNTNMISNMIEDVKVIKDDLYTPKIDQSDELLTELVWNTAKDMYGEELPTLVSDRIERELGNIIKYGFGIIYYISHKLVAKSLEDGYLVGSRGSVGSSVVATFSGITEVNPLPAHYLCKECKYSEFHGGGKFKCGYDLPDKYCPKCEAMLEKEGHDIPFETFLGFEADKVPDIDLNFSGDYQATIHHEVKRIFGDKHAFRAGTISTVAEKTAFGYVRAWAEETGKTISRAFTEFMAKNVKGTKRTTGQHPGGIIIIPSEFDVEDFSAINYPANDVNAAWKTTHFDFHAIHDNVLKLDLLGHDDPTAIKMLERLTGVIATEIPNCDKNIISLFSSTKALGIEPEDISGETTGAMGIPEFGTKFVRGMLKSVKVETFADLVSISGLSHGTDVWANNGDYLIREHNKTIGELISCRDDIMTYLINKGVNPKESFVIMEQVRKGKSVTAEQEAKMVEAGVEEWYIESCKKIKYMFPKAHATAYVKMAWRIAWFKLYHPLAYYATYFTTRADVSDVATLKNGKEAIKDLLVNFKSRRYKRGEEALTNKEENLIPILELAEELYARGFKVSNIDINKSLANEWRIHENKREIIPPFSSIDGLGDAVAISIVKARQEREFTSVEDVMKRSSLNKTSCEKLKKLGVFEGMEETNQLSLF